MQEFESLYIKDLYYVLKPLQEKFNLPLLDELITKLKCLIDVGGLHHLSLNRQVPTLY